jgi:hypothetical protein
MCFTHIPGDDTVTGDGWLATWWEGSFLTPQQPSVFDLPKVLAVGIASPAAAAITARFGVAGTLIGLALSAVFVTAAVDFLKVYLARVPGAVTTIPGGFRKRSSLGNVFERMRRPFSKFASLPRPRRRSILIGSIAAAGISFVVGLIVVTGLELGVGKSLSCWVWEECSTEESSADDSSGSARASTLPSVLGGGQGASSSAPQVEVSPSVVSPSSSQLQPASQAADVPGAQEAPDPSPSAQPGQRQGPSGPVEVEQQQVPSGSAPADQQSRPTDEPEGQQ